MSATAPLKDQTDEGIAAVCSAACTGDTGRAPGLQGSRAPRSSQDGILHGAQIGTTHASNHGPGRWLVKPLSHKRAARRSTAAAESCSALTTRPCVAQVRFLHLPGRSPLYQTPSACVDEAPSRILSDPRAPFPPPSSPKPRQTLSRARCLIRPAFAWPSGFPFPPGPRLAGAPVRCPLLSAPRPLRPHGPS